MSASEEVIEELQLLWRTFRLGLKDARPWAEFFEVFKPPMKTDVERRMSTNLLHYGANYCQIVGGAMALAVVVSPRTILALLVCGLVALGVSVVSVPSIKVGDHIVVLNKKNRCIAVGAASLVILGVSGALLWLLLCFSFSLLLALCHMALRPRSFAAKYNAATDQVRALFGGNGASCTDGDEMEGGGASGSVSDLDAPGLHSRGARRKQQSAG